MLRSNLATRPFYNERGVRAGLLGLALIGLVLTLFNAIEILRLGAGREARQLVAQNASQARDARQDARHSPVDQPGAAGGGADRGPWANVLIDRRAFCGQRC